MKQYITPIIIATASLMFTGCGNEEPQFDATGAFEATEITVSAENSGKIIELELTEGTLIGASQNVGVIDSTQLHLSKLQLLSTLNSVEVNRPSITLQLSALKDKLKNQVLEKKRIEKLLESRATPRKRLDDINSAIEVTKSQIAAQKSTLSKNVASIDAHGGSIEVQIAQIDDLIKKCRIVSPIEGVVLAKYAEQGEFTMIGKPLFKIADTKNIYIRAYVTSSQLANLQLSQQVKVFADYGGQEIKEYAGVIEWISEKSEFTPKNIQTQDSRANLVYAVKIAVKNDGFLKLGMYGFVRFN